jgi:Domain of unknown function DUF11
VILCVGPGVFVTLFVVPFLVLAAVGSISPRRAAAQLPPADLAILRVTGPQHTMAGRQVTFKILATNLGPAPSELDVGVSFSAGLALAQMTCDFGISPDTPFCEYSNVAPGTRVATTVVANVLAGAGPTETATFCTNNEGQTEDSNATNDCATVSMVINGA